MKFTFKKEKRETGLRAIGYPYANTRIFLNKKEVGIIAAPSWQTKDGLWRIRFMVKKTPTTEEPAPFRWAQLVFKDNTEAACRKYILDNSTVITNLNLHSHKN